MLPDLHNVFPAGTRRRENREAVIQRDKEQPGGHALHCTALQGAAAAAAGRGRKASSIVSHFSGFDAKHFVWRLVVAAGVTSFPGKTPRLKRVDAKNTAGQQEAKKSEDEEEDDGPSTYFKSTPTCLVWGGGRSFLASLDGNMNKQQQQQQHICSHGRT